MAEWGMEEQLLEFARDLEANLGDEGVRRPKLNDQWLDVLSECKSS
jgi:hypothetical protein